MASQYSDRILLLKVWRGMKNYRAVRKLKQLREGKLVMSIMYREREREEGSNFCGYLMWHNCGWFSCYHGDGCKGNKDSLGFCEI